MTAIILHTDPTRTEQIMKFDMQRYLLQNVKDALQRSTQSVLSIFMVLAIHLVMLLFMLSFEPATRVVCGVVRHQDDVVQCPPHIFNWL
jgi:hypothetical protein